MAQSDKVRQLHQIILAIEQFETRKNSLFSLEKLANYLNLSERELEEMIEIVFRFQNLFNSVFTNHVLVKKWKNDKSYLILKEKSGVKKTVKKSQKKLTLIKNKSSF